MIGVLIFYFLKRNPRLAYRLNTLGLSISTLYLVWSVGAHTYVSGVARDSLEKQNIIVRQTITGPAPFNTLLWRTVAMTDSGYAEGFYSLFDETDEMYFTQYDSDEQFLESLHSEWAVQRLQWFSKGFYKVSRVGDDILISDLRMGVEPLYFFTFAVGKVKGDSTVAQHPRQIEPKQYNMGNSMSRLWERIWSDNTKVLFE
jgi:inner membrane protein